MNKAAYKALMHVLNKLTDRRFIFSICINPDLTTNRCEMYYYGELVSICRDISDMTAFEILMDLIANSKISCSLEFYIYLNNLKAKEYYSFKRARGDLKWRRIANDLAYEIITYSDGGDCLSIDSKVDNMISNSKYDCYYYVQLKSVF